MAPEGCAGLLPIPRSPREHDSVAHLQASRVQALAECSGPPQSARQDALGTLHPSLEPVDSSTPRSAPLSRCTLLRHPSFIRAVCVNALVRLCAGGDQRWSTLPRQQWSMGDRFLTVPSGCCHGRASKTAYQVEFRVQVRSKSGWAFVAARFRNNFGAKLTLPGAAN